MFSAAPIPLSELQRRVREALAEQFPLPLWITAEISELKVNRSGHCYLELIEKADRTEADGIPTAQARAVVWRSVWPRLAAYFEAETGAPPAAGMQILAQVLVTYHERYGFSLQINDIDTAFTLGDMARQRRETIARLQREGAQYRARIVEDSTLVERLRYDDYLEEFARERFHMQRAGEKVYLLKD